MNPHDILDVADALSAGNKEAEWRSGVSRAYYAAFHVARKLFRQFGFTVPIGEQAHAYLWLRLANCRHPDLETGGDMLRELRKMRNWADYEIDRPMSQIVALQQFQIAANIVQVLDDLARSPSVCAPILVAIKTYERDVLQQVTWHA